MSEEGLFRDYLCCEGLFATPICFNKKLCYYNVCQGPWPSKNLSIVIYSKIAGINVRLWTHASEQWSHAWALIFSNYQLLNHGDKAKEATKILLFDVFDNEGHNLWHTRYNLHFLFTSGNIFISLFLPDISI